MDITTATEPRIDRVAESGMQYENKKTVFVSMLSFHNRKREENIPKVAKRNSNIEPKTIRNSR